MQKNPYRILKRISVSWKRVWLEGKLGKEEHSNATHISSFSPKWPISFISLQYQEFQPKLIFHMIENGRHYNGVEALDYCFWIGMYLLNVWSEWGHVESGLMKRQVGQTSWLDICNYFYLEALLRRVRRPF